MIVYRATDDGLEALDGDRVVGRLSAKRDRIFGTHVARLDVAEEYRGSGVGTELLRRAQETLPHLVVVS